MQFLNSSTKKYSSFSKRLMTWTVIFSVSIIAIFIYSETAHAGLISYISTFLGGEQASAKITQNQYYNSSQTIALLQAATNFDPNPEKASGTAPIIGNALVSDIALSESVTESDTTSTQISSYIVREGDTLSGIAKMFGVSVNTVMWANDLSRTSTLRSGQILIILPITGIKYTVGKGDTIKGIALKYKANVDEILQYNDISLSSTLVVGQTIIIPDAELQVSVPTKSVAKTSSAHDTNGPNYSGYYSRPVKGGTKTQGLHGYNGVDIASYSGASIYAAASGKVILSSGSGWNGGYGNLIIISHNNGTQTVYGHLSKNLVSVGQYVEQGQQIALMGATGKVIGVTGVHLHFEIRGAKNPF